MFLVLIVVLFILNSCSTADSLTQIEGKEWNVAPLLDKTQNLMISFELNKYLDLNNL
jgi:hypothetical protein